MWIWNEISCFFFHFHIDLFRSIWCKLCNIFMQYKITHAWVSRRAKLSTLVKGKISEIVTSILFVYFFFTCPFAQILSDQYVATFTVLPLATFNSCKMQGVLYIGRVCEAHRAKGFHTGFVFGETRDTPLIFILQTRINLQILLWYLHLRYRYVKWDAAKT